jgi:DNA-binding NtrC family response regulator
MSVFTSEERQFAESLVHISYCNPFLPERIAWERTALGTDFDESAVVWSQLGPSGTLRPNVERLGAKAEALTEAVRVRWPKRVRPDDPDWKLYLDVVDYVLHHRHRSSFMELIRSSSHRSGQADCKKVWRHFIQDFEHFLAIGDRPMPAPPQAAHVFAGLFQIQRGFTTVFSTIVGTSMPVARLRAAVWQSIFTHDLRRYRDSLFARMGDFTTLITGPSGTGKELVARAIGLSRYIPFDPIKESFADDFEGSFHPINLSALAPTVIESELFGHVRGAFTGAVQDRAGWLEVCRPLGTVFLDEIGELDASIQVKLLRLLQSRTFQRLGDTGTRSFQGKIIAATHQDLTEKIQQGIFREDFYYRLCSDMVRTPSLREQLADSPDDLRTLVNYQLHRILGHEDESLATRLTSWIEEHLGRSYVWPGNVRELEQCVRNLLVRGQYQPRIAPAEQHATDRVGRATSPSQSTLDDWMSAMCVEPCTADELLSRYCTLVYCRTGSYEQTARQLHLDRRTVKAKIDHELLDRWRSGQSHG